MKDLRDILLILSRIAIEIGHWLGIVYIKEYDAQEWPFDADKAPVTTKAVKRPDNLKTRVVGGDLFKAGRTIQQLEDFYDMEGGAAWDLRRYDGKENTPDFTDWHQTDDMILALHEYTQQTSKNYMVVRPLVVSGMSNKEIAAQTGWGIRKVESVAASVRAAFRMRIEQAVNPSPAHEIGEGEE